MSLLLLGAAARGPVELDGVRTDIELELPPRARADRRWGRNVADALIDPLPAAEGFQFGPRCEIFELQPDAVSGAAVRALNIRHVGAPISVVHHVACRPRDVRI